MEFTKKFKEDFLAASDQSLADKIPVNEIKQLPDNIQTSIIIDGNGNTHVLRGTHTSQLHLVQSRLAFEDNNYSDYDNIIAEEPYPIIHDIYNGGISVTITTFAGKTSIGVRCYQIPNSNQELALINIYNSLANCNKIVFTLIKNNKTIVDRTFNTIQGVISEINSLKSGMDEEQRNKLYRLREFRAKSLNSLKLAQILDHNCYYQLADLIQNICALERQT
jgi:hypothetical protein